MTFEHFSQWHGIYNYVEQKITGMKITKCCHEILFKIRIYFYVKGDLKLILKQFSIVINNFVLYTFGTGLWCQKMFRFRAVSNFK